MTKVLKKSEYVNLTGVPETMLWPLWNRAAEAHRKDPLLDDPMSADLVSCIDYDFEGMFGRPHVAHAIRARYCDDLIKCYLGSNPQGTVIALGEGLETGFWRVDNDEVHWYCIDMPESIEVRRRLVPAHERNHLIACSALDESWFEEVPSGVPVFISASGLLMYFTRNQVVELLNKIVAHFKNAELFFDIIPPVFSKKTLRGYKVTKKYTAPQMPFGLSLRDVGRFAEEVPGLIIVEAASYAEPFSGQMKFYEIISLIPWIRNSFAPGLVHAHT